MPTSIAMWLEDMERAVDEIAIVVRYLPALRKEVRSLRDRYPNA